MGETDQPRSLPVLAAAEEGEAAIIETSTHADPVALSIKAHQRHEDQIKPLRRHDSAVMGDGLEDTKAVALER